MIDPRDFREILKGFSFPELRNLIEETKHDLRYTLKIKENCEAAKEELALMKEELGERLCRLHLSRP